jgi:hypothetical protein
VHSRCNYESLRDVRSSVGTRNASLVAETRDIHERQERQRIEVFLRGEPEDDRRSATAEPFDWRGVAPPPPWGNAQARTRRTHVHESAVGLAR